MTRPIRVHLMGLYQHTLLRTQLFRPWACDASGEFIGLRYRYEFTDRVIGSGFSISDDEIRSTDYWRLLTIPLEEVPRDGGRNWVYHDPMVQARRFIQLIRSITEYGYSGDERSAVVVEFEETAPPHLELKGGSLNRVSYQDNLHHGLIQVETFDGTFHCRNGNHRLAALASLHDQNLFRQSEILAISLDPPAPRNIVGKAFRHVRRRLVRIVG